MKRQDKDNEYGMIRIKCMRTQIIEDSKARMRIDW